MAFVPCPGVASLQFVYDWYGQIVENVFNYIGDFDEDTQALEDLADAALTTWQTYMRAIMASTIVLQKVIATSLATQNAPGYELTVSTNNTGQMSGEALPFNCAMVIKLITAYRGRSYRGRIFLPGQNESVQNHSLWDSGHTSNVLTAMGNWTSVSTATGPAVMCVLSRYHNGSPRATGVATPISGMAINPYVASQRRRLPGRGR